jgi:hypothetical protein
MAVRGSDDSFHLFVTAVEYPIITTKGLMWRGKHNFGTASNMIRNG